jgi:crotonobetainyl-CoA:carnitine CoA-transferase CaiB-like acyl-CoA transferase
MTPGTQTEETTHRFLPEDALPLRGIKVLELSHMIMGPAGGLVLADLGAEVIKVEPLDGDRTRRLKGSGIGYFPVFSRNKQSLAVDLKSAEGQALVRQVAMSCDMLIENFRDDSLAQYGLDYATLSAANPGLIYVSLKGFLSGPYKHRTALDEVVQMMGGMAWINGSTGAPQRVAPSVNDILGGTFGGRPVSWYCAMNCETSSRLFSNRPARWLHCTNATAPAAAAMCAPACLKTTCCWSHSSSRSTS